MDETFNVHDSCGSLPASKGTCAVCGSPVHEVYPWWTKNPEKYADAKPIHVACHPAWLVEENRFYQLLDILSDTVDIVDMLDERLAEVDGPKYSGSPDRIKLLESIRNWRKKIEEIRKK